MMTKPAALNECIRLDHIYAKQFTIAGIYAEDHTRITLAHENSG